MATSGSISKATAFGSIRLSWEIVSQSGLSSTLKYSLDFVRNAGVATFSDGPAEYKIIADTVRVASGSTNYFQGYTGKTSNVASAQSIVNHNADGTKRVALSFEVKFTDTVELYTVPNSTFVDIGTVTGSGNAVLNSIAPPTKPELSPTEFDLGDTVTITTPRSSASYKHTLYYYDKVENKQLIAENVEETWLWNTPLSFASVIPNASSRIIYVRCETYDATGVLVGVRIAEATAKVPDSLAPKINDFTITDPEDHAIIFGSYVQKKSRVRFTFKPEGQNGATIKGYKATVAGVTIPFDPVTLEDGSVQITSGLLNPSGYTDLTLTVTDSRGLTTTRNNTVYIHEYFTPTIARFTAGRADANKNYNEEGTYIKFDVAFNIAPVNNKNEKALKIEYKKKSETTWSTLQTSSSYYTFDGTITSAVGVIEAEYPYDFRLTLTDYFGRKEGKPVSASADVAVVYTLLDFHESGKAMAFGKICEITEGVEFDLPVYFRKPVHMDAGVKVLWQGAYWMQATGNDVNLAEPISQQPNGIVLIFSKYASGAAQNYQFNTFFVHKHHVALFPGKTNQFLMSTNGLFDKIGSKILTISDEQIVGNDSNKASGTANGITYDNSAFVLRYVLGV